MKNGFSGALTVYESLFDQDLQKKQHRKLELGSHRIELQTKVRRLEREISGITPRLAANIALVADFFPTVDVQRLEQVEAFHQKIGSIVKKELKDELAATVEEERATASELAQVDGEIQASLQSKGLPDDVFNRVFELKGAVDKAAAENYHYESKLNIDASVKDSSNRLEDIYAGIFLTIEGQVNSKLRSFNKVVYGPSRVASDDLPPISRTRLKFVKSVNHQENDGHEEEQIQRGTDHRVPATGRGRDVDQGAVPQRRLQRCHLLQVACQVRRHAGL